jgi:hypothetical protein
MKSGSYATLYRYPEGDLMPDVLEVQEAVKNARRILLFVKNMINIT